MDVDLSKFVILDIETIGLDKETGKIIELAALRVENWVVVGEYSQLVNPGCGVPRVTTHLTGIKNKDVKEAPSIGSALDGFLGFIGDLPAVGHNIISFDKPYIEYNLKKYCQDKSIDNVLLDTLELSHFLKPELKKHKLEYLYKVLVNKNMKQQHRALDDCRMTFEVLKKLKEARDNEWELNWLKHVGQIAKRHDWSWADFILGQEKKLELGEEIKTRLPVEAYIEEVDIKKLYPNRDEENNKNKQGEEEEVYANINPEEIDRMFEPETSPIKKIMGGRNYEYRAQQHEMAKDIADSINDSKILAVEAPTGCGKSLAYLVPSAIWSVKNKNKPVVISTYTNNLQDQLFEKDSRILKDIIGSNIKVTVVKGREHYVCIRKLKQFLEDPSRETNIIAPDRQNRVFSNELFALFLANWVIKNKNNNCDFDRFSYWLKKRVNNFQDDMVTCHRDTCQRRFCPYNSRCFLKKIRYKARTSNIIITNHSQVFMDNWQDPRSQSVLPHDFMVLVLDEAINLEDVVTGASTVEYSRNNFNKLAQNFFDKSRPKSGFIGDIRRFLGNVGDESMHEHCGRIGSCANRLIENNNTLFKIIEKEAGARDFVYDDRVEIFPAFLKQVETSLSNIQINLNEIASFLLLIFQTYCSQNETAFCYDLKNYRGQFVEYAKIIEVLNELNKNKYIFYRTTVAGRYDYKISFCHKSVGDYLHENMYGEGLKSIVLTSATLTYNKNFDYVKKIWGLNTLNADRVRVKRLNYLFNYSEQCALFLVTDLPNRDINNPGNNLQGYYPKTSSFVANLFAANNGSGLCLFTRKKDVEKFGLLIIGKMEENNIPLFVTGKNSDLRIFTGSHSSVTEEFRDCVESCLLGTAGLREGIDVSGRSLELVVIVRMPFAVPTDPVHKNRKMIYGGYDGYSLPHSIFDIKQAFGRLIRTKKDNGFVFLIDDRAGRYRSSLANNLPNALNIVNLPADKFRKLNELLVSTKGMDNRVRKCLEQLTNGSSFTSQG